MNLEQVKSAIATQGMNWEAGNTAIGRRLEAGNFRGLGFSIKGQEPSGGRGRLSQQAFAFQGAQPPALIDWRNVDGNNWTTAIRDQEQCGACVAFATCAALEARMKIKKGDPHFNADLSVGHLFFCGAGERGCEDGWQIGQALKHCKKDGVGKESDFRYRGQQLHCMTITPCVRVSRWHRVKETFERKNAIRSRGPVVAGMVVYSDFVWYRSGVYRPTTADAIGLHAVSVIGYDDEKGCWIVKNSLGTAWGEGGFVRIGYGTCGIDAQFEFYDPEVELL